MAFQYYGRHLMEREGRHLMEKREAFNGEEGGI
jgi:hypothetical protein